MTKETSEKKRVAPEKVKEIMNEGWQTIEDMVIEGDLCFLGDPASFHSQDAKEDFERSYLSFNQSRIEGHLEFERVGTFAKKMHFQDTVIEGGLSLVGVTLQTLDLRNAIIRGNLCLSPRSEPYQNSIENLYLSGAKVKGSVLCGENISIAMKAFLHFGSDVEVAHQKLDEIVDRMLSKGEIRQ